MTDFLGIRVFFFQKQQNIITCLARTKKSITLSTAFPLIQNQIWIHCNAFFGIKTALAFCSHFSRQRAVITCFFCDAKIPYALCFLYSAQTARKIALLFAVFQTNESKILAFFSLINEQRKISPAFSIPVKQRKNYLIARRFSNERQTFLKRRSKITLRLGEKDISQIEQWYLGLNKDISARYHTKRGVQNERPSWNFQKRNSYIQQISCCVSRM